MSRVGLIGCGRWGKKILRDLLKLGAEVEVAVPSAEGREAALGLGASAVHGDVAEMPALDGYVVAVPTVLHAEVVEALIPHGRPIFVEKPLTPDPAAARRILEAAPDLVFVMDKWRYHPGIERLGVLVRDGALGRVRAIRSYRLGWGNPHRDVDSAWILLPHDLSIALEILGDLPPALHAFGATPGREAESLIAVLGADDAPQLVCELSSEHPRPRRSVVVVGETGSAQLGDSYDTTIRVTRPGAPPEEIEVGDAMPLEQELAAFLGHLGGGPPPRSSAAEAVLIVERVAELRRLAGI